MYKSEKKTIVFRKNGHVERGEEGGKIAGHTTKELLPRVKQMGKAAKKKVKYINKTINICNASI